MIDHCSICVKRKEKIETGDLFVGYFIGLWTVRDKFTGFKTIRGEVNCKN